MPHKKATFSTSRLLSAAKATWGEFKAHPKIAQHLERVGAKGIVLQVRDGHGRTEFNERIGSVPDGGDPLLQMACRAVSARLTFNPRHVLSYQSSDRAPNNQGAAVRLGVRIIAGAGIPEELAHLFILRTLVRAKLLSKDTARKLTFLFPVSVPGVKWEDIDA